MWSKVLVFILFTFTHGVAYPSSRREPRKSHVSAESHPLLASVFSVANAVRDINHESRMFVRKGLQHLKNGMTNFDRHLPPPPPPIHSPPNGFRPQRMPMVKPAGFPHAQLQPQMARTDMLGQTADLTGVMELSPERNLNNIPVDTNINEKDTQSQFLGPLADMQCSLCQQAGNQDCIRRFCWGTPVEARQIQLSSSDPQPPTAFGPSPEIPAAREVFPVQPVDVRPMPPKLPVSTNDIPLSDLSLNVPPGPPFTVDSNTNEPAFATPIGIERLIRPIQSTGTVHSAVPVLAETNPPVTTVEFQNPLPTHSNLRRSVTNFAGTQEQIPAMGNLKNNAHDLTNHIENRKGLNLLSNTLTDHPLKSNSVDKTFETQIGEIERIQLPVLDKSSGAHLDQTANQNSNPAIVTRETPGSKVPRSPDPIESIEIIPLSTNTLRRMIQTGDQPQIAAGNPITEPQTPNIQQTEPAAPLPTIPAASDVFVTVPVSPVDHEQHTLVLKSNSNGEEKVGIVIGDTQPTHAWLSLLETSGQLPAGHSASAVSESKGGQNTDMSSLQNQLNPTDTTFVPLSSILSSSEILTLQNQNTNTASQRPSGNEHSSRETHTLSNTVPNVMATSGTSRSGDRASMTALGNQGLGQNSVNSLDIFPSGFVEALLSSTTAVPTMNPRRKKELQDWGAQFIPANI